MSSHPFTGFGTAWIDADNDGDADLVSFNGAVSLIPEQQNQGDKHPLRQRNQLWLNHSGTYKETEAGSAFELVEVSRGAAFGDLDNDGDIDILVTNNNGPVRLYRNDAASLNWIGIELKRANMHVTGNSARLRDIACSTRVVRTDGSYASASDPRIVFGLGGVTQTQFVVVKWKDGDQEVFGPLEMNRYHELVMGSGNRAD